MNLKHTKLSVALIYLVYIVLACLVIPGVIVLLSGGLFGWPVVVVMLVVCPIASYFIPRRVMPWFVLSRGRKILWYVIHTIFVLILPAALLFAFIALALSQAQLG